MSNSDKPLGSSLPDNWFCEARDPRFKHTAVACGQPLEVLWTWVAPSGALMERVKCFAGHRSSRTVASSSPADFVPAARDAVDENREAEILRQHDTEGLEDDFEEALDVIEQMLYTFQNYGDELVANEVIKFLRRHDRGPA